jgi:hypothetical protein
MELHLAQMEDTIDQLTSLGEDIAEHLTMAIYLSSLLDSYCTLITALETRPEKDLTPELVKGKLLEEFKRRQKCESDANSDSQRAMKVAKAKSTYSNAMMPVGKPEDDTKQNCFFCKKPGHQKKECHKYLAWKGKQSEHRAKLTTEGSDTDEVKSEQDTFVCFKVCNDDVLKDWYIDFGTTAHMSCDRSFIRHMDEGYRKHVVLADGQKLTTEGKGEGILHCVTSNDKPLVVKLTDVLFVPQLKGNLILVKC